HDPFEDHRRVVEEVLVGTAEREPLPVPGAPQVGVEQRPSRSVGQPDDDSLRHAEVAPRPHREHVPRSVPVRVHLNGGVALPLPLLPPPRRPPPPPPPPPPTPAAAAPAPRAAPRSPSAPRVLDGRPARGGRAGYA